MTDIEQKEVFRQKAIDLINEYRQQDGLSPIHFFPITTPKVRAFIRSIQLHEKTKKELADCKREFDDFRQEVSDAVWDYYGGEHIPRTSMFAKFVTPKPDPLEEVLYGMWFSDPKEDAKALRAALETRGLEIREKNDDD